MALQPVLPDLDAIRDGVHDLITACVRHDRPAADAAMVGLQRYLLVLQVPLKRTQGALTETAETLALFRAAKIAYDALLTMEREG